MAALLPKDFTVETVNQSQHLVQICEIRLLDVFKGAYGDDPAAPADV